MLFFTYHAVPEFYDRQHQHHQRVTIQFNDSSTPWAAIKGAPSVQHLQMVSTSWGQNKLLFPTGAVTHRTMRIAHESEASGETYPKGLVLGNCLALIHQRIKPTDRGRPNEIPTQTLYGLIFYVTLLRLMLYFISHDDGGYYYGYHLQGRRTALNSLSRSRDEYYLQNLTLPWPHWALSSLL